MRHKRRFKSEKLIRDKMPELLHKLGGHLETRSLGSEEYTYHLKLKLKEEAEEVLTATTKEEIIEEIADVLEVLIALVKNQGLDLEFIDKKRLQKRQERGGFERALLLECIEVDTLDDHHPVVQYCLARPEVHCEITKDS